MNGRSDSVITPQNASSPSEDVGKKGTRCTLPIATQSTHCQQSNGSQLHVHIQASKTVFMNVFTKDNDEIQLM